MVASVLDRPCHLVCGDVLVKSPLVQISDFKACDDFELVAIFEDDIEVMIPIATNNMSIKEVAQELNFPEQFTFRKYFKQHTGLSPKEYKMKHLR